MKATLELNDRESGPENTSLLSDNEFLKSLRLQMLKFATVQLSDSHLAEDAVQKPCSPRPCWTPSRSAWHAASKAWFF